MRVSRCLLKAFRNLFNEEVVKVILMIALPLFLIYFGVLYFFWDNISRVIGFLISWVPFSVLKLNGAFFILFILWFLSVISTFAIINALFLPFVLKKESETFHFYYTAILIGILSLIYAVLFISKWDYIHLELQKLITLLPFTTISKAVGDIVAIYIFYNFFILLLFLMSFLFSKPFLEAIKEYEYGDVEIDINEKFSFKRVLLRDVLVFVVLFVLLFPLFFVPILNVGVQIFLWIKLYKDSFLYFICNEYCSKDEFEEISKKKGYLYLLAFFAALFNFLPIINFFAPFFAMILFFHCVMELKLNKTT
ncbi:MAG: EI24 domain-containing protein [Nautiliaceae bacterium]